MDQKRENLSKYFQKYLLKTINIQKNTLQRGHNTGLEPLQMGLVIQLTLLFLIAKKKIHPTYIL